MGIRVGGVMATLLLVSLTAGGLGEAEFGLIATFLAGVQIAAIPILALQTPVLRSVAVLDASTLQRAAIARQFTLRWSSAIFPLLLGCLALLVLVGRTDPALVAAWAPAALFYGAVQVAQGGMRSAGLPVRGQLPFELARPLTTAAAIACLAHWNGLTVVGAAYAHLLGLAVAAAMVFGRRSSATAVPQSLSIERTAYVWFLLATSGQALLGRQEILMVGWLGDLAAAGDLSLALALGQIGTFGLSLANFHMSPGLAAAIKVGDMTRARDLTRRALLLGLVMGLPFSAVMILSPTTLVTFIAQPTEGRLEACVLIGVALLVNVICGPAMTVLTIAGEEKLVAIGYLLSTIVSVAVVRMTLSATPVAGALGYLASVASWNFAFAVVCRRRVGIDPSVFRFAGDLSRFRKDDSWSVPRTR